MSCLHKDFHGYHNFIINYVEREFGRRFLEDGLRRIGRRVYSSVSKRLAEEGLSFFAEYWKHLFEIEGGRYEIHLEPERLTLKVNECPAVSYIKEKGWPLARCFCEHTRIVNEEICRAAGYRCSVHYDQSKGRCVQVFWQERIEK